MYKVTGLYIPVWTISRLHLTEVDVSLYSFRRIYEYLDIAANFSIFLPLTELKYRSNNDIFTNYEIRNVFLNYI